jgi:hypothetical protein
MKMEQLRCGTSLNINPYSQPFQERGLRAQVALLLVMITLSSQGGEMALSDAMILNLVEYYGRLQMPIEEQ